MEAKEPDKGVDIMGWSFLGWEVPTYKWEDKLALLDSHELEMIGLSKEKLHEILEKLSEYGVVE